ncbi:hypothetical protein [Paenibacillus alginolyticus]|uniref:Uncharacterized protein n=2 Tax=Paenibacillus alginolyticus TaxID=59839 RepID=A0ABT4GJQ5_9BACL|nr:hypothetical protein [Paenibacillus alginolyticus]MCY9696432.1 hypothetical protein [Paenibacillus alginolyticus]
MIVPAKVKNGKSIHKGIDMGGFLYIACQADPTTMKTEKANGEINCKRCLGLKNAINPNYSFATDIHALRHPFCKKNYEDDGFGAGWHDGKHNLKKFLPNGLNDHFIKGYNEGYFEGQQNYSYHHKNGNVKDKPLTKVPLNNFGNSNQRTNNTTKDMSLTNVALKKIGNSHQRTNTKKKSEIKFRKFIDWITAIWSNGKL